ncbi:MAG: peptidylprolyl isomerase [Gammaproteobacteria bacterium]|nr:peptidylprolyl isomerase [Gammaproteobacteria bacterium]
MRKFIACAVFILGSCWIAAGALSANLDRVIAIVNDDAITFSDYVSYFSIRQLETGETTISGGQPLVIDKGQLESLIDQRLQVQEALRRGLNVTESELDIAVRNISLRNGLTEEQLLKRLALHNITKAEFTQSMGEQILIQKVVNGQVARFVRVSDQEIEQFVRSYPDLFEVDVSYELSHLQIAIGDADAEQANARREYLHLIRDRILSGQKLEEAMATPTPGFDDMDFEYLGWRNRSLIPDQIIAEIEAAGPESATDVLEVSNTLHLFVIHARQGDEIVVTQKRLRQILIDPGRKSITEPEALDLTWEIRMKIQSGEDFSSLARKFSDDLVSAAEGGDIGWVNPDDLDPELAQSISDLGVNELSEPVSTLYGYFLVEVLETRIRNILQDVIRGRARDMIFDRKANSQFNSWIARIRSESYIEIVGVN